MPWDPGTRHQAVCTCATIESTTILCMSLPRIISCFPDVQEGIALYCTAALHLGIVQASAGLSSGAAAPVQAGENSATWKAIHGRPCAWPSIQVAYFQ
jgi:hypothetical protein